MNLVKLKDNDGIVEAVKVAGQNIVQRITWSWQEDLMLKKKWNFNNDQTKALAMREFCFIINDEQVELLHPVMEEEPKCQVTFGEANLETLSLVFRFNLTDMKVTGTMRCYSTSKLCKSFPYELLLKNVEFEIMAGLSIRKDSIFIEAYSYDFLNYNVTLSYKNKDESKEIFPLDSIQNQDFKKSLEKYTVEKLCKDIVISVQDRISDDCIEMSISGMLYNEYTYRNRLRLHKKKMSQSFNELVVAILNDVNLDIKKKNLEGVQLPKLYGQLMSNDNGKGYFRANNGLLESIATLQKLGDVAVHKTEENAVILLVLLYFSYLNITYKDLRIIKREDEESRTLETPDNSNSAYLKLKVEKITDNKVDLTLVDFKIDDIGYIDINWEKSNKEPYKKEIEPEVALWLNFALEYHTISTMEDRIKNSLIEALKNESLSNLALSIETDGELYDSDSDPLCEEDEEENEDLEESAENNENTPND